MCGRTQQGPGVPGWTRRPVSRHRLGPGNTIVARWVVPTRYTPPGTTPPLPPRVPHPARQLHGTPSARTHGTPRTCTYDQFEDTVGDPRGVITQVYRSVTARLL